MSTALFAHLDAHATTATIECMASHVPGLSGDAVNGRAVAHGGVWQGDTLAARCPGTSARI
ncbi:hypothetical protein [Halopseudomonas pertucinogena]|uniref:Uncharacterized protein n=1 Tax=Halopseudomonas pertucinogena TaxID=86175 RepID=A0ABQ2CQV0_9GAMM|nr:hypothetical protein [Halopseudomonas pertucinogena]GGJ02510.1 hypothetical protein GCM10009083_19210 [Halopseudomonas pertucinogena]